MKNQANKNSKNLAASISEAGIDSKASAEMIHGADRVCSICNRRASDHVDMDHPWRNFAIEAAERSAVGDTEWTVVAVCDKCGLATADCDCYVENHGQTVATFAAPRRIAGTDEYVVIARDHDGKRVEAACYYTDDLDDAKQTRAHMQKTTT